MSNPPTGRPPGRPWVLADPTKREELLNNLRAGLYVDTAARLAGVSDATVYNTLREAEFGDNPQPWMVEFLAQYHQARATAEARAIANIQRAGADARHWQANGWFLERSFPERYGRQRVTLEVSAGLTESDPHEQLAAALDQMNLGGPPPSPDPSRILELPHESVTEGPVGPVAEGGTFAPGGVPVARTRVTGRKRSMVVRRTA